MFTILYTFLFLFISAFILGFLSTDIQQIFNSVKPAIEGPTIDPAKPTTTEKT
jgi:hypothetical protein